jgi:hypothetical protein
MTLGFYGGDSSKVPKSEYCCRYCNTPLLVNPNSTELPICSDCYKKRKFPITDISILSEDIRIAVEYVEDESGERVFCDCIVIETPENISSEVFKQQILSDIEKVNWIYISEKCECGHWDFEHPLFVGVSFSKEYEKPCKNCKCNNFKKSDLQQQNKKLEDEVKQLQDNQKTDSDKCKLIWFDERMHFDGVNIYYKPAMPIPKQIIDLESERDSLEVQLRDKEVYLKDAQHHTGKISKERDELKKKIQKIIEVVKQNSYDNMLPNKIKEILGEQTK